MITIGEHFDLIGSDSLLCFLIFGGVQMRVAVHELMVFFL
jgi:hypothetical protein